jgi:hypothetical protein
MSARSAFANAAKFAEANVRVATAQNGSSQPNLRKFDLSQSLNATAHGIRAHFCEAAQCFHINTSQQAAGQTHYSRAFPQFLPHGKCHLCWRPGLIEIYLDNFHNITVVCNLRHAKILASRDC